jgi:hypothetical protein
MGMRRLHFEKIAVVIRGIEDLSMRRRMCREMAEICAASNCRFDIASFENACNINPRIFTPAPAPSRMRNDATSSTVRDDRVFSVNRVRYPE